MTKLDEINSYKRQEISEQKLLISLSELRDRAAYHKPLPSFKEFLLSPEKSGIVAEHKRQSPSKGVINDRANLETVVKGYETAGASAISVLTDQKYFGGSLMDLAKASELVSVPVLRKDFMLESYQLHEARAYGAAVVLLIAASLSQSEVDELAHEAHELGMEVLFEIHTEKELEKISEHVDVVGVNNRNLKTFTVDLEHSIQLLEKIPDGYIKISESGLSHPEIVKMLRLKGFQGFLMGENFMKEDNPGEACRRFIKEISTPNPLKGA